MLNRVSLIWRLTKGAEQDGGYGGQDGRRRYVTEVVADDVRFPGSRNDAEGPGY